jgi:hypothetical protein
MKRTRFWFLAAIVAWSTLSLFAHPGSGIAVDSLGNVYFVDTGSGVWRLDRAGTLTKLSGPAYHWMAFDAGRRLQDVPLPYFSAGDATVSRISGHPDLLMSSDFPVCVDPGGNLYYPRLSEGKVLQLYRLSPSGTTTVFKTFAPAAGEQPLRWLNGLAVGADGSVYYSEDRAIRKISRDGGLTTLADAVTLASCDPVPGIEKHLRPYFRGLDVDANGVVYVAASGCRAVIKISPDKRVSTVLRASGPWSPTGVTVSGSSLYVLEYTHDAGDDRRAWKPRVRRVGPDGSVTTVATVDR